MMIAILFRISGMLAVVAIGVLSLVPGEQRPHVLWPGSLEHAAAYFAAAALLSLGFSQPMRAAPVWNNPTFAATWRIAGFLTVYAALLEVAQHYVPGRMPSVLDWAAGTLAAWLGAGLIQLVRNQRRTR